MIEKWLDINGYENEYQISNFGRLKSIKSNMIMKPMVATNGYLIACLWKNGKQRKFGIHRLVAAAFIPNPNNYKEVNHKDEDKTNNNANNLEWCSHKYNMSFGNVREKISNACKGKTHSEETKEKLHIATSKKRWINNGIIEKYVYVETLETWLSLPNWKRGRINCERKGDKRK